MILPSIRQRGEQDARRRRSAALDVLADVLWSLRQRGFNTGNRTSENTDVASAVPPEDTADIPADPTTSQPSLSGTCTTEVPQ